MLDWQTIAVALLILAACAYVGRRGLARLRSFRAGGADGAACSTGCGSCGGAEKQPKKAAVMVQISSRRTTTHR